MVQICHGNLCREQKKKQVTPAISKHLAALVDLRVLSLKVHSAICEPVFLEVVKTDSRTKLSETESVLTDHNYLCPRIGQFYLCPATHLWGEAGQCQRTKLKEEQNYSPMTPALFILRKKWRKLNVNI